VEHTVKPAAVLVAHDATADAAAEVTAEPLLSKSLLLHPRSTTTPLIPLPPLPLNDLVDGDLQLREKATIASSGHVPMAISHTSGTLTLVDGTSWLRSPHPIRELIQGPPPIM
jgi:hypothetical protein